MSITIPIKIPVPFGYAAGAGEITTPIPAASQIGIVNGRASLHDGFPPDTFIPISTGGVPPFGADFNGILNEITSITQWQQAGGFFPYDSTFSTAISGYPVGAIIQAANYQGFWLNTTNGNTTNPDTGGAGWTSLVFEGLQAITVTTANVTVTQLQSAYPILVISGALTGARSLILPAVVGQWIVQNNTTGAFALTVKTAAGTGIVATQGQSTYLYGDGTNIYFASSVGVASFNTRTGTVTLNATDVTTALGYIPYNATNPDGFAKIASPTFTGIPAAPTAALGNSTTQLATTAFVVPGSSLTANGYEKFPSGLIMQWGSFNTGSIGNEATGSQSFPIAFTNLIFNVIITSTGGTIFGSGTETSGFFVTSFTTTGFSWQSAWASRNNTFGPISYLAIGY
jgi:hypothetical protein